MDKIGPIIKAEGITKTYGEGSRQVCVLNGIDLEVKSGEFITILGPSGSGKSTLLHILGAMDMPSRGRVHLFGRELNLMDEQERSLLRNRKIGFVFQFDSLLPEFTLIENIMIPACIAKQDLSSRARELTERFGLSQLH
ncbi:MAG: ATP-binding cassette domain-containing protein, partial [Elusimicrobia bacterium]|nr:ATP-binding cassette domain-containing protein [Elusimicrobiota bacterium]